MEEKEYIIIKEGKASLKVPNPRKYLREDGIYEPSWAPVFYNPEMAFDRDLTVVLLNVLPLKTAGKETIAADILAGTGVRAIRYCLEVSSIDRCLANDIDQTSYEVIKANVKLNNLNDKLSVLNEDANSLLYRLKASRITLDFIDIDPFGSPSPYIRAALWAVRAGGYLAITATDIAPLMGIKWEAGSRKYDVHIAKTDIPHEVGIRTLLGYVARRAAEMDRYVVPVISYARRHYIRVIVKVLRGAKDASKMKKTSIGYLEYCPKCLYRKKKNVIDELKCPKCGGKLIHIGPLWVNNLLDTVILEKAKEVIEKFEYMRNFNNIAKLINLLIMEGKLPNVYDVTSGAEVLKVSMPKRDKVIECLEELGYSASRSHYGGTYVRSEAGWDAFLECIKSLSM